MTPETLHNVLADHVPAKDLAGVIDQIMDALDQDQKGEKMTVKFVEPKVTLLAHSNLALNFEQPQVAASYVYSSNETVEQWMNQDYTATDAETLVEFAGRACYQSFHKPNPATRDNKDYLERTVFEQQHGSITEHAVATIYLEGVSRACTHEIVRHRHLSPSQLSQRFVDEGAAAFVAPPALRHDAEGMEVLAKHLEHTLDAYNDLVHALEGTGLTRKQIREAARSVLPNCTETKIVLTGNLRAWQHFIELRTAEGADAEIQQVARMVQELLHTTVSPVLIPLPKDA